MRTAKTLFAAAVAFTFVLITTAHAEPFGTDADLEALRAKLPEKVTPVAQDDLISRIPSFFYFDYNHQPTPGKRLWLRVSADKWIERYPDGTESTFAVLGRTQAGEVTGTILVKVGGDPAKTDTDNQGKFLAFIPDKQSAVKEFLYRNTGRGDAKWSSLGEMKDVE